MTAASIGTTQEMQITRYVDSLEIPGEDTMTNHDNQSVGDNEGPAGTQTYLPGQCYNDTNGDGDCHICAGGRPCRPVPSQIPRQIRLHVRRPKPDSAANLDVSDTALDPVDCVPAESKPLCKLTWRQKVHDDRISSSTSPKRRSKSAASLFFPALLRAPARNALRTDSRNADTESVILESR